MEKKTHNQGKKLFKKRKEKLNENENNFIEFQNTHITHVYFCINIQDRQTEIGTHTNKYIHIFSK